MTAVIRATSVQLIAVDIVPTVATDPEVFRLASWVLVRVGVLM
jgi:hypothetical protein